MAYSTEDWQTTLESLVEQGSWRSAALSIGCAESTLFATMDKSRKMAKENAVEHPLFFEWRSQKCWYHVHARRARLYNIQSIESEIRESVKGQIEVVLDPSTNRPLPALDEQYIGRDREWFENNFLDYDVDRFLWERDADGNRIRPIYQTKKVSGAAALKIKAIAGLLPDLYGEKASLDVNVRQAVTHIVEQAPYVPRAQRVEQQQGEIVEGEYTEIPALPAPAARPDIEALRREAARLMADPHRPTARPTAPVDFGTGGHGSGDPPEKRTGAAPEPTPRPLSEHPRAYLQPQPQPAKRPAYAKPAPGGMKVV